MYVVATAGHVDHGKSTLVRALTGTEPDRWAEERRRGMTIDLGYAWTTLPSGAQVAFVDVPGHERFIGNMLAGLGPAPAVMFVVAADEGWRRQSDEHLAAIDALGLRHGLLAVTRSDLAEPMSATAQAQERIRRSSLGDIEAVTVSGATGQGLPELRAALDRLTVSLPPPRRDGRVRLWVDRSFVIRGSGTVVTGTLGAGSLHVGEELELRGRVGRRRRVTVRGLQSLHQDTERASAVARVAVNLRSVDVNEVRRGDALLTPGAWLPTSAMDVRLQGVDVEPRDLPEQLMLHVGTVEVTARVRPLGGSIARITVAEPLPVQVGDRAILRDPTRQTITCGVTVLDADPPRLNRRGAAARRAAALADATEIPDVAQQVSRRGYVRRADLVALGVTDEATTAPEGVREVGRWLVSDEQWERWAQRLEAALTAREAAAPLSPWLTTEAARHEVGAPDLDLVSALAVDADLTSSGGRLSRPGAKADLDRGAAGLATLENRWAADPFVAPEHHDLAAAGLGTRELAAAVAAGRVLRLPGDVVLQPSAPALAMRVLAALPQPFTVSQARQALGTTRRVAVPLLEHLDAKGWTVRIDETRRRVAGGR